MFFQILLAFIGFCAGVIIAGGITGLVIGLSITPRYAGITHTGRHIMLYEDMILLGTVFGNLFSLFHFPLPLGQPFLLAYGLFTGIFLGAWLMALAEMADVFPIFTRRIKFTEGLPKVIVCVAVGKICGSLLYYFKEWI